MSHFKMFRDYVLIWEMIVMSRIVTKQHRCGILVAEGVSPRSKE